jgi:hypothetical protein
MPVAQDDSASSNAARRSAYASVPSGIEAAIIHPSGRRGKTPIAERALNELNVLDGLGVEQPKPAPGSGWPVQQPLLLMESNGVMLSPVCSDTNFESSRFSSDETIDALIEWPQRL